MNALEKSIIMTVSREFVVAFLPCAIILVITSWVMMLEYGFGRIFSDGSLDWDELGHGVEVSRAASAGVGCFTRFSFPLI